MSEMMKQVGQNNNEAKGTAATGEGGNPDGQAEELPRGTSALTEGEETPVVEASASEETSEGGTEGVAASGDKKKIQIGDREFESEAEAFKYAEELERKVEGAELYNQGIRDALAATGAQQTAAAEPEDNFEERFYANPKETLKEVQTKARDEALAVIRAEQKREQLWTQFLNENPDLRRKDAQRILDENWDTIGKITDLTKAMKVLAQRTRAEYEEIRSLGKPRTELQSRQGQVVSPSGGTPARVTQQKKNEAPLDFVSQLKSNSNR